MAIAKPTDLTRLVHLRSLVVICGDPTTNGRRIQELLCGVIGNNFASNSWIIILYRVLLAHLPGFCVMSATVLRRLPLLLLVGLWIYSANVFENQPQQL